MLQLSYLRFLKHQVYTLLVLGIGAAASLLPLRLFALGPVSELTLSGLVYAGWTMLAVWIYPGMIGRTRLELAEISARIRKRMSRAPDPHPV
jgi:hypothetical protein